MGPASRQPLRALWPPATLLGKDEIRTSITGLAVTRMHAPAYPPKFLRRGDVNFFIKRPPVWLIKRGVRELLRDLAQSEKAGDYFVATMFDLRGSQVGRPAL